MYFFNRHIYTKQDIEHYISSVRQSIKNISNIFRGISANIGVLKSSITKLDSFYKSFAGIERDEKSIPFTNYVYLPLEVASTNGTIINNKIYAKKREEIVPEVSYRLVSGIYVDGEKKDIEDTDIQSFVMTGPLDFEDEVATPRYLTKTSFLFDGSPATDYELWVSIPSRYNGKDIRLERPVIFELSFSFMNTVFVDTLDMYIGKGSITSAYATNPDDDERRLPIKYTGHFTVIVGYNINNIRIMVKGV